MSETNTAADLTKLPARDLRRLLAVAVKEFNALPRRSSFSGLYLADQIEGLQRELDRRGLPHEIHRPVIRVEMGG